MIIKGGARGKAGNLAAHVLSTEANERIRIVELVGVVADTVPGALAEMAAHASGTRATKPLYHASISPDPKAPPLTPEQWKAAIDRLEQRLGLGGCARAVLEHSKAGADGLTRTHRHVVWSRTDPLTGRAVPCKMNWAIHERVGRELEAEYNHAPVCGGLIRTPGRGRPSRGAKDWETQQRGRTGVDPQHVKRQVTTIWHSAGSGRSFQAGLAAAGLTLARGDKAGVLVLIDARDGVHGLGRRIEGVTAAEIKARLADLDPAALPTVREARARLSEKAGGVVSPEAPSAIVGARHPPRIKVHAGHLPRPSSLAGGKSRHGRGGLIQRSQRSLSPGKPLKEPEPARTAMALIIDFAIPEDRPGINPLEILDAIQKLKRAIGAGAKVEESLKRMEAIYGRLMLHG